MDCKWAKKDFDSDMLLVENLFAFCIYFRLKKTMINN